MKIKTSIVGVSGYTGLELVKLLIHHPVFELNAVYASENHQELSALHCCLKDTVKTIQRQDCGSFFRDLSL